MQHEQIFLYIRENLMTVAMVSGGIVFMIWLMILFQVTRTRREAHKICKKIQQYFDVILADDPQEEQPLPEESTLENTQVLATQAAAAPSIQAEEAPKSEEDVKLLMEVLSEVF